MNKPNAPGEGSELPAMGVLEAAQALVEAMGTCHICKGLIILQEYAVHCEDCSYYCENHDGPGCVPIYELHRRLKAALSSSQQESGLRTVEAWCCGIAADDELGETDIKVYAAKEACEKGQGCAKADPRWCAPRKLTITFGTNWIPAPPVTAEGKDRG